MFWGFNVIQFNLESHQFSTILGNALWQIRQKDIASIDLHLIGKTPILVVINTGLSKFNQMAN